LSQPYAFAREFNNGCDETGISAHGGGPSSRETDLASVIECDRVKIPDHLHVVTDKSDRNYDHTSTAIGTYNIKVIADIWL
jgi:hypothetical protein